MMKRDLRRREFLRFATTAFVGTVAVACGAPATTEPQVIKETEIVKETVKETEIVVQTVEVPKGMTEPPMLEALVKSGVLPAIEDRLPTAPYVVGGREAIGTYGGDIRMTMFDTVWFTSAYDMNSDRLLQYSDADYRTIYPHVLESYEVTPDGKEWTFYMRKGMKWSDGTPMTNEDVRFWWEDWQLNTDLKAAPDWQYRFGGEPMKVEFPDDYTYKFTFAVPFGNFGAHMTRWHNNSGGPLYPSHFLKRFHPKYADATSLDAAVADAGVEGWVNLFGRWGDWGVAQWQAPVIGSVSVVEYPVCNAWHIVEIPQDGLLLWERNPYYWKVDLAGNQLPYIDTMRFDYVANLEANKLKMAQGEMDIVSQHDVTIADYPFYKENEATSNYTVSEMSSCMSDRYVFFPQHFVAYDDGTPDEGWNDLIQNHPEFMQALSVAVDREEINESKFYGLALMGQICPHPTSKYYKPEYGQAFASYDPEKAGELLDSVGCTKGADGMRTRPDGKKLEILIEHAGSRVGPSCAAIAEMIATYWNAIGIATVSKEIQESLYTERMGQHKVYCGVWHADRCTDMLLHLQPQWYIPTADWAQGTCSSAWTQWYQAADRKAEGLIEPPVWIQDLYGYFEQMSAVVSEDERIALGQKIFDFMAERPLEIGLIQSCPAPLLFNKNMRNLPRTGAPVGWDTYGLSTYHPEAFFYEGGVRYEV